MSKNKIGIMGGTFDPIHIGHLIIAEEARDFFNLKEVVFIPTGKPPHKKSVNITDSFHRYNMTQLAIKDNKYFSISSIEVEKSRTTYTIDTIKELKKQYENTEFYFIIGGDSVMNLHKWKNYETLLEICNFIVAKRVGISNKETEERIRVLNRKFGNVIYEIPVPYINISSTEIRAKVINNKTIKYYVSIEVEDYIIKNKLYLS